MNGGGRGDDAPCARQNKGFEAVTSHPGRSSGTARTGPYAQDGEQDGEED